MPYLRDVNDYHYQKSKYKAAFRRREKYHLKRREGSLTYQRAEEQSRVANMLFFKNVDHLRRQKGLTWQSIMDSLERTGVIVKRDFMQKLRYGHRYTCQTIYLQFFCTFFEVSIGSMFSQDMEAEQAILSANKKPKKQPTAAEKSW